MAFNRLIEKNLPNDGGRTSNGPRLVVIVPDQDLDVVSFSRTIHVLASPGVTDVLLMTVVHNFDSEMASRRRLATIGTLVRDFGYEVEAIAYWGRSWVKALEKLLRPGDRVLCPPEMSVRTGLRKQEALGSVLRRRLDADIRFMPGFYVKTHDGFVRFLLQVAYWVVVLGILAGFFFIESDVARQTTGWVSQTLMVVLMIAEVGTVYLWTVITG